MLERMAFVRAVLEEEETVSELCRSYGISRRTGYKWLARYEARGEAGLDELSRAPHHQPHRLAPEIEAAILALRARWPRRGPKKLMVKLRTEVEEERLPSLTTIANVLSRHGLSAKPVRRRHATPSQQPLAHATESNRVWCIDFKGWFHTADGTIIHPLTITDAYSRYLICLQALRHKTDTVHVMAVMQRVLREYGLPERIRSDNGPPFASVGLGGLTRLSAWWIRLGISPERIEPGCPYQNGRHERFHLTLLHETVSPAATTFARQQARFVAFQDEYNYERPHEALGQVPPANHHRPSPRPYPSRLAPIEYGDDMVVRRVRGAGQMKWRGHDVLVTCALRGEPVGLVPIDDGLWAIYYCAVRIGVFDERRLRTHSDGRTARIRSTH